MVPIKPPTFRELVEAAAKPYAFLWKDDGELNTSALARHCAERGYYISQPSLSRLLNGRQVAKGVAIEAMHHVFGIPRAMLRGELPSGMDKLLTDFKVSTLLLAKRIEELDKEDYQQVAELIDLLERKRDQLRRAIAHSSNVTSFKKDQS